MSEKNQQAPRQDWNPHWAVKAAYRVWMVLFAGFKIAVGAAATVLLIALVCGFVFVSTLGDYLQDDVLPNAGTIDITGGNMNQNSHMYYLNSQGKIQEYQQIFAESNSEWASYDDIPKAMVDAAIAIEDHRFLEHQGVDWITTLKACARMFFGDDSVGGSSITQQLIKNLKLQEKDESADDVTVQRKVQEIFRAVQVEKNYDKKTIMEKYLNVIYLGQGCYGVRSAAATYFGKELQMLTPAECASIISITNNPSLFDPYGPEFMYKPAGQDKAQLMTGRERNRNRQLLVLGAMKEYGLLDDEAYRKAISQELVFKNGIDNEDRITKCVNPACGYESVVKNFIRTEDGYHCPICNTLTPVDQSASQDIYSWFADVVLEDVAKAVAEANELEWGSMTEKLLKQQISAAGYHIYTTIDLKVQNEIDKIYQDLNQIPETRSGQQLQSAIVIIDNRTGDIVGLSGGVGQKGFDDWNRATDSRLQSGSSIKPLAVYAPAFELGTMSPATVIKDMPISYDHGAYPLNDTRTYSYSRTIRGGVQHSVNAVSANTLMEIGIGYSFDFAKNKFGLSSLIEEYRDSTGYIHSDKAVGPLALGAQTYGVHVRDMANGFATFANNGVYRKARTFTKVYDSEGKLVLDNTQKSEKILSDKTVDYMNYCMYMGTTRGTGYEADLRGFTTAGKTGTSGDSKDRWYCGFTSHYTAAVWCGFDKPEPIRGIRGVNNPSAYLFNKVMTPIHKGLSNEPLYNSGKMTSVEVCLDSGKLATSACHADIRISGNFTRVDNPLVYPEDRPREVCDKHVMVEYCSGGGVATEWCKHFAEVDPSITFKETALVKMTEKEIIEIQKAENYRLDSNFLRDDYVYLINNDGSDGTFKGFHGKANDGVDAPYVVCPIHTQAAWEKYQHANPTEPETEPPVIPELPTVPVEKPTDPPVVPVLPTVPHHTEPEATKPTEPELPQPKPTENTVPEPTAEQDVPVNPAMR